jgi:predicted ester cyclase
VYDDGAIRVVRIGLAGGCLVTAEENKIAFLRTYDELLNQGNLAVADEVIAPDFVNHEAPPGHSQGPESMRALAGMLRTAFPDLHFTIEELIAEGDLVAGRVTMRGTHQGPYMGMAPTGRRVEQAHMHFVRFQDGKAFEHWGVRDDVGLLRQLGLLPEPPGGGHPPSGA